MTTELNYPYGTNHDCTKFQFNTITHPDTPNDFEVVIFDVSKPTRCKAFKFTDIKRLSGVIKHISSLTTDQIKDFLKDKK